MWRRRALPHLGIIKRTASRSASSSPLWRGSNHVAKNRTVADARDKPEHDDGKRRRFGHRRTERPDARFSHRGRNYLVPQKTPFEINAPDKNHIASIPASTRRDSLILSLGGEPGREPDPQDQHPVPDDG
jgi:hypothetical protein